MKTKRRKGEKVHGNNDTTKKWNLKCKCRKLDGDNYTKKDTKTKTLNPKLEPKPNFWKMSVPIPILNPNLKTTQSTIIITFQEIQS